VRFPVLILVPGLAFDRLGNRLGRGAGYYDRFLESFFASYPEKRDEITLAGVCHSFQIVERVPVAAHDIPVDCLLTENGCILCSNT
jgi:5-formyltetrahydrofolate cyclo-ligase